MKTIKKVHSGIFRDGGAGAYAKRRYRDRRNKLMEKENSLMVITGVPYGPGGKTVWAYTHSPTYQEPSIMYLTGINQNNVVLLLDPKSKVSTEILFVGRKDRIMEFWEGVRFGVGDKESLKEVQSITGIKDVRDIEELKDVIEERFLKNKKRSLATFWYEGLRKEKKTSITTDHNYDFKQKLAGWLRQWKAPKDALKNIMPNHFELRLPLDKYDIANARKAQEITGAGFKAMLKNFGNLKNECQVQGFVEGQMLMNSPYGLSYPSIVASGTNATILHYMKNDDPIAKGEMMLMDFGIRWMTMHADITRSFPVSGKFNPMQKMLYEIVLKGQREVEKAARAGVTVEELNEVCWAVVNDGLEKKFVAAGGKYKLRYKERPHGVSHLMGEQEHDGDPFRNYAKQPMEPGWMISNEPGLYGKFKIRLDGKTYDETIGIRIEDNLVMTQKGCMNLSSIIPKSVREIEKLMKG
ncbi:MAG: aminopeptidase P N-terminal domain-containing protein [Nitrospinaceae bacterium]|nr:aminopeptidase P N-terminal domain-containing protein [Nitrospinaceae bacterium]